MIYDEERYMPQEPSLTLREEELMDEIEELQEKFNDMGLELENMEIDYYEVVNENELLKAQVYNLTLYMKTLWENPASAEFRKIAEDFYDGMPGYVKWTEDILK